MSDEQSQTSLTNEQLTPEPLQMTIMHGRELFPSVVAVSQTHRELLRRYRRGGQDDPDVVDEIEQFINHACATGFILDNEEDRWATQGLIDYWTTVLYRLGRDSFDTSLEEFDSDNAPDLPDEACPYLGLGAFSTGEQDRFFGRDRLIEEAVNAVEKQHYMVAVGPSGSGKSSLVLAGVLPALQNGVIEGSDEWLYLPTFTPGENPLANLATILYNEPDPKVETIRQLRRGPEVLYEQLTILAEAQHASTAVLFIDEFEELFTLCLDENIRNDFIANLVHAFERPDARHRLIIACHSDFENQVNRWPRLKKIFTHATVRVTPPTAVELRDVIAKPAAEVGLRFDAGLIDRLLQDVSGERLALPLLQFTLLNLWDNRDRNRISWEIYNRVGGGRASLVAQARQFYSELSAHDKLIAQRIFLALVDPSGEAGTNLLRVTRGELLRVGGSPERITAVLDQIEHKRLVRLVSGGVEGNEQYELVHDALTQDWPELVEWLDEKRFEHRQRLRLRAAAQQWQTTGHDASALWRGALLQDAKQYSNLNDLEQTFLTASVEAEEAQARAREIALQREIEQARILAKAEGERAAALEALAQQTAQSNRRLIVLAVILALFGTLTLVMSVIAFNQRNEATQQAQAAQASEDRAVAARITAVNALSDAQRSAQEARAALRLAQDNARTAAEALEAARLSEEQTRLALAEAVEARETAQASALEAQRQSELARSGQVAAQAFGLQDEQLDLSLLLSLEAINIADTAVARGVLLSGLQNAARLTRLQQVGALVGHSDRVFTVDFWPTVTEDDNDGTPSFAVSGGYDNQLIFWDLAVQEPLYVLAEAHGSWVRRARFNHDGTRLATGGYDNRVLLWDTADLPNRRPTRTASMFGHSDAVNGLVFVPPTNPAAGEFLLSGGRDGLTIVWNVTNSQRPVRLATLQNGATDKVYDLAVSPNGQIAAVASADTNVYLYNISNPGFPSERPIRILRDHANEVNSLAFSPDGTLLATGDDAGRIIIWRVATGENLGTLTGHANWILSLDFHPDGQILASSSRDNTIILWDVPALERLSGPFVAHNDWVWEVRFDVTGEQLLSAGRDNVLYLWNLVVSEQLDVKLNSFDTAVTSLNYGADDQLNIGTAAGEVWSWPITATTPSAATSWILPDFPSLSVDEIAGNPPLPIVAPDGAHTAVVSGTQILLWSLLADGETNPPQILRDPLAPVRDFAFSADGQFLAAVSCVGGDVAEDLLEDEALLPVVQDCSSSQLWLWSVGGNTAVLLESARVIQSELISVAFSPDGSLLAAGGCQRASEADNLTNQEQELVQQQEAGDKNLCQAGETVVWGLAGDDENKTIEEINRFSQTANFEQAVQIDFINQVAFSYDNAILATASAARTLAFWDVDTGEPLSGALNGHTGEFNELAFSPDGELLASVGNDREVLLWDLHSLQRLSVPLQGHNTAVLALSFQPDGRYLVTGDDAGELIRWRVGLDSWRELACGISGRDLFSAEWVQYIGLDIPYRATCRE